MSSHYKLASLATNVIGDYLRLGKLRLTAVILIQLT